jgi:hypothetical protein
MKPQDRLKPVDGESLMDELKALEKLGQASATLHASWEISDLMPDAVTQYELALVHFIETLSKSRPNFLTPLDLQ